jgi:hypothetical protein
VTINGSGSYSFLLTAIDGQRPGGGGVDRFRLKVRGPGGVIYDNQVGDGDDAAASTALGGGIVIHGNRAPFHLPLRRMPCPILYRIREKNTFNHTEEQS